MKLEFGLIDSFFKHIKGKELSLNKDLSLNLFKNERFAFQLIIKADEDFFCNIGKELDISRKGLINTLRISAKSKKQCIEELNLNFLGYVKDDNEELVCDPILKEKAMLIKKNDFICIWVEGKVSKDVKDIDDFIEIKLYESKGYEKEKIANVIGCKININDLIVNEPSNGDFYLDVWQHLSNWARHYNVEYFSEQHFKIIENYIKELGSLSEKVITIVASDYSWAGQGCYKVEENSSNLFELNIIKVFKNENGDIDCDFSSLDRYIDICFKYGINKEIDIFGLIANWNAKDFGNPLKDYVDPIRISYFDKKQEVFNYIDNKNDFKSYLKLLFNHFKNKGLWNKVRVISDEPNNAELFKEWKEFISSCVDEKIKFKTAIHNQKFYEEFKDEISDISLNTCEVIRNIDCLEELNVEIEKKDGILTWYSCCFPKKLNTFIKSPLIESRLTPWFSYFIGASGFLRWAYALWPQNIENDIRYKKEFWPAGDMFFVYPGKDMNPVRSIRWENLRFGIQDYNLFLQLEKMGLERKFVLKKLEEVFGHKENMKYLGDRNVKMNYSLNGENYVKLRQDIYNIFIRE